ncbi:sorting nexin-like protein [Metarhizium album ARSEF 1941]|uniref:Endosomal/vacuolar adapter protein YPT35 n=1 Tax=Metarhizium album (strain ARSEF 1941) TaxID=1081103 RepID=A0A0B2WRF4_METAS|nr:sorting nexin-like protein [Metarhizium album ARSEF 1941]KHN95560.1 sorting nexin-like protein [Metarhizium album ARSEF 1941]
MAPAEAQEMPAAGSQFENEAPELASSMVVCPDTTPPPPLPSRNAQAHDQDNVSHDDGDVASPTLSNGSVASPPYWMNAHAHHRNISNLSVESILPAGAIVLQDNDTSEHQDRNNACWARSVEVINYTVVNGGATSVGAFVVWNVRVETLSGSYMNIRKRYSEFDEFRAKLVKSFPGFEGAVPSLPPKSVISRFRPKFLDKRRAGLQYFLKYVFARASNFLSTLSALPSMFSFLWG